MLRTAPAPRRRRPQETLINADSSPHPEAQPAIAAVPRASRRGLLLLLLVLLAAGAAVVVTGVVSRRSLAASLQERAAAETVRTVSVMTPQAASASATLELPGRLEAWSRAPLFARVGGYLRRWTVDIGAPVKAGQLLAEIETPELDQQLLQAQAELATAVSAASIAEATAKRWQDLFASGMVSGQAVEEKKADWASRGHVVRASQANLQRLQTLKGFARIVAPFDGVVTARNTDVGALIGTGSTAGSELFVVSDTRRLRAYVSVPQSLVASLKPGSAATLSVPEQPGVRHAATVQSMAQAISSASGGMLVQLVVDNSAGTLLPGAFARVSFEMPRTAGTYSIPPSALILGKAGPRVATVAAGDVVVVKPVKVARDLGTTIEIGAGLEPTDRVIENPPDGVGPGDRVRVATRPAPASAPSPATTPASAPK